MAEVLDYIQFVLAPQVVTGLAFGVAVILVALGLTIIFGLLDVINMSHGEFYAFGAFAALALGWLGHPVLAAAGPGAAGDAAGGLCGRAGAHPARVQQAGPPRHDAAADVRAGPRARGRLPARLRPQPLPPGNADSRGGRVVRHLPAELPAVSDRRRRARDRRRRARGLPHAARRDGACRRLRPQHGGVARRAGGVGLRRRLCVRHIARRALPAFCWRRSIPCSRPWGATSS